MMEEQEKRNIIQAWPVYVVLIGLFAVWFWWYRSRPSNQAGKPLGEAISAKLDPTGLRGIIEKRNRSDWDVVFEGSWGERATDFSYTDIQGKTARLTDHRGKNVLLIFWATWCPPCRKEIPHLIALRKETPADQLEIIAFSNESKEKVAAFAQDHGLNYTVVAEASGLPAPFGRVRSIPTAFFIDPEGKIKLATVGVVPEATSKAIFAAGPD